MEEKKQNLSAYAPANIPDAEDMSFGIVVSEWNTEVTDQLREATVQTLLKHGVPHNNIIVEYVPGSFELPLGAQWMMSHLEVDAVICLGCVIQGETRHFDFICQGVTQGIVQLNQSYARPVIYGVLTTNDMQQALDRAGGKHGNKGTEAAVTAIKMVALGRKISGNQE